MARTRVIPILLILTATAWAAACGGANGPSAEAETGRIVDSGPAGLYTVGRDLYGLPRGKVRLDSPPVAPLAGWLTPAAVPSPDGRYVAYNAWQELRPDDPQLSWEDQGISRGDPLATPSIRVYDSEAGTESLLAEGAFSLAWRGDGALAYFSGSERDHRAGAPYVGDVIVRASFGSPAEVWSPQPGRYIVAGWAGTHLIAHRELEGEALDVVVLDGPGRLRVLAEDSTLVAISPDGRRALVEQGPAHGRPLVRVLDVEQGREEATLDLTTADPAVGTVGYAGHWSGDLVVAPSESGLAVFRVRPDRIDLVQTLRAEAAAGIAEPRFAGPGQERVVGWTSSPAASAFIDCDLRLAGCDRLVPGPKTPGVRGFPAWRRPVYNPSRPLEGER